MKGPHSNELLKDSKAGLSAPGRCCCTMAHSKCSGAAECTLDSMEGIRSVKYGSTLRLEMYYYINLRLLVENTL